MAEAQSRDEVLEKVAVLEDPLKAAILTLLMRRPASIAEVASELDLPIGRARYQLRRLHQAGMVELTEVRPRRGVVERVYRRQPSIVSADEVGLLSVEERGKAVATVLKLVFREALSALRTGVLAQRVESVVARIPLRLDDQGWKDAVAIQAEALDRLLAVQEEASARLEGEAGAAELPIAALACLLLIEAASEERPG